MGDVLDRIEIIIYYSACLIFRDIPVALFIILVPQIILQHYITHLFSRVLPTLLLPLIRVQTRLNTFINLFIPIIYSNESYGAKRIIHPVTRYNSRSEVYQTVSSSICGLC
jgi:hypothetical protein